MSGVTFQVAGASHPGRKRARNDDWFCLGHFVEQRDALALEFDEASRFLGDYGLLCAVADGIGGYAGGSRAAQVILETLSAQFYARKHGDLGATGLIQQLQSNFANVSRVLEATLRAYLSRPSLECAREGEERSLRSHFTFSPSRAHSKLGLLR